jgi:hypothetical protein
MRKINKIIKLFLCIALFVGLFSLNVGPMAEQVSPNGSQVGIQSTIADYMGNRALAEPTATTPATTGTGADANTKPKDVANVANILTTVAQTSTYVHNIFNPLINFLTFGIGAFLGNDYIFAGTMGTMLHTIWVISRNIVNIIFVLILLFLALKYIFSQEETNLGKILPKFVLLLIAVNFSWLAGKLVLDAANVASNVVFSIPAGIQGVLGEGSTAMDLESGDNACKVTADNKVTGFCAPSGIWFPADTKNTTNDFNCNPDKVKQLNDAYKVLYPINAADAKQYADISSASPSGNTTINRSQAYICWQQIKLGDYNQNTASYYLTYSMARVQNLTRANTNDKLSQLAIGTLFSLLIEIVYLMAFASLYIALIIRVAFLWVLMAFSPLIVLLMFSGDIGMKGGKAAELLSFQNFAKWAFAPTMVGAVWSVGFIMVTAGQTMTDSTWKQLNSIGGGVDSNIFSSSSLLMGMDSIQQFIWLLMTTGIIWMGTFSVLGGLDVVKNVTDKIKGIGTNALQGVGEVIKYAPIIPMGGEGKHTSLGGMMEAKPLHGLAQKWRDKDELLQGDKMGKAENGFKENVKTMVDLDFSNEKGVMDKFRSITGLSQEDIVNNIDGAQEMVRKYGGDLKGNQKILVDIIGKQKTYTNISAPAQSAANPPAETMDKGKTPVQTGSGGAANAPVNAPVSGDQQAPP